MSLTPKQEIFAQAICDGKSQADAYRIAFKVGPNTKPETTWTRASQVMANVKVRARVDELKAMLTERALWTREQSVGVLAKVTDDNEAPRAAVVSAVKELNAMFGFNAPTKHDHQSSDGSMSPATPTAILAALERKHRDT